VFSLGVKCSDSMRDSLLSRTVSEPDSYLDRMNADSISPGDLDPNELLALAAFGGSSVTRECSRLAFSKKGRSLQASDLTDEVFVAFTNLFEGSGPKL
jgi:NAD(P)H-hydrate repair Nnr-like enzyme with NAD(P)H-hydrate dehydratase domain